MVEDNKRKGREGAPKQMHAVIDRIEDGGVAVLLVGEDEKTKVEIPVSLLPGGARDGDHLRVTFTLDRRSRAAAENRIQQLQDQLKQQSDTEGKTDFKL